MAKQIYVNLIINDLEKSTSFYESLGFIKQPEFSNKDASGMKWSEEIFVMLLTKEFAKNFSDGKEMVDAKKCVTGMYCLSLNSKEEVDAIGKKAEEAGGRVYRNKFNDQFDFMYGLEIEDPDGHIWEPMYMDMTKFTPAQ